MILGLVAGIKEQVHKLFGLTSKLGRRSHHNLDPKLVTTFYKELSDGITSKLATYLYSLETY